MTSSPISTLPRPSKEHATCAWCAAELADIVELIAHVDTAHLDGC